MFYNQCSCETQIIRQYSVYVYVVYAPIVPVFSARLVIMILVPILIWLVRQTATQITQDRGWCQALELIAIIS